MDTASTAEQLFLDCRKGLFGAAMRTLRNAEDAEDCVQETGLRIVRFWDSCRDRSAGHSWALSILYNQVRDVIRKRHAGKREMPPEGHWDHCTPSHEGMVLARLTLIRATARLTAGEREALALWVDGRRSVKEVGPAMHTREYRALHRMRSLCRGVC